MTDTTITRIELVNMAGDELRIVASGQSLEAEDQEKIDARVDGLLSELDIREVVTITDDDNIPIEYANALAILLANASAGVFGKPNLAMMDREAVEDRLKVMVRKLNPPNRLLKVDAAITPRWRGSYSLARWRSGT